MNSHSAVHTAFASSAPLHLHLENEACPSCGQEIPPEKLEEIHGKIASRERERALAITTNLEQRFEAEKAEAEAKAKASLERAQRESAARESAVREETQKAAEALMNERLAAAEQTRQEQAAELQKNLDDAAAAQKIAEETKESLQAQLLQSEQERETAVEAAKTEAKQAAETSLGERIAEVKNAHAEAETALKTRIAEAESEVEAAKRATEAAIAEKLAEAQSAHTKSEAALQARIDAAEANRKAAEESSASLSAQVTDLQKAQEAEVAKIKEDAAAETTRIRQEATKAAESALHDKLAANEEAVAVANAKVIDAETKLSTLTSQHESAVAKSLEEQREVLEKANEEAINSERAKAFEDTQKLSSKVNDLQRALEKKTNEELGEGAEIDLFEALKKEFPDDRITRIKKGDPGADILHVVLQQGRECGTIIYDSKNHKAWRTDHVAKLKVDQLAANAEHAILSTHKFPQGTGQLHLLDGVVLANPARVVLLATLVRRHLLQVHTLRLSGIERENKTEALYEFITSERCTLLFDRIDGRAGELIELQAKEIRWHENNWKKQGETFRAIQKANAELENEISNIVGTSASDEEVAEAS
jgi:hypothetical protein